MRLHECLDHAPYATLLRIARHYGVTVGHDCHRAHLLARLHAAPLRRLLHRELERARANPALSALPPLEMLAEAGGRVDRAAFERLFGSGVAPRSGPIPPHPPGPWLAARGLLFALRTTVVMPDELVARVPRPAPSAPPLTPVARTTPLYDLALLLATARQGRLALDRRNGRVTRRAVAGLLVHGSPGASAGGLDFLAVVAVASGLLAPAARATILHPTPALDVWLAADSRTRMAALWQGWTALTTTRPHAHDAHPCRDCPSLRAALIRRLIPHPAVPLVDSADPPTRASALSTDPAGLAGLVIVLGPGELALLWAALPCASAGLCPTGRVAAGTARNRARAAVRAVLAGPLHWLGLAATRDGRDGLHVALSPWGAALLGGAPWPADPPSAWRYEGTDDPAAEPGARTDGQSLRLAIPLDTPIERLYRLSAVAAPLPGRPGRWQVAPDLVRGMLRAGASIERLFAEMEDAIGLPLPLAWRRALAGLARPARPRVMATLNSVLLLESAEPLPATDPPLATLLARTLSPRAAVVHPARVPALRRALAARGLPLHDEADMAPAPAWDEVSPARRVATAVALNLLGALAERGLPAPPLPASALGATTLTEAEDTAVALWSRRLRHRLDALIDGDARDTGDAAVLGITRDDAPPVPVERDLAALTHTIEAAIAGGDALRLRYSGAGAAATAWRVIEPHRLEVRHGHTYLRAYCRWRRDERLFRLDRIGACDPVGEAVSGEN